jgi:hypothetical protein
MPLSLETYYLLIELGDMEVYPLYVNTAPEYPSLFWSRERGFWA